MNSDKLAGLEDLPLNYREDQRGNLDPQVRELNLKLGLQSALEFLLAPPAALLIGGALGLIYKRRYALASLVVGGMVLRQTLSRGTAAEEEEVTCKRKEIEFERRALKAQRGDYGRLEVIAFK
ncbi:hypothetical protein KP001_17725 [Geomonas subterranea]|uniref:Uncharacterized protein n=1 Tax=Geomonas subterranea TaxID=2847989 RepID=A0ABX8LHQ6_9BACT|nr:hypothetical protein [Geomonas subterranea]QXE90235.1 hypothetical protein KP001_17725 [Geomonas subterranea]QXM07639.1 hypothetical protein KP002_11560 [Geomonas subterranea]